MLMNLWGVCMVLWLIFFVLAVREKNYKKSHRYYQIAIGSALVGLVFSLSSFIINL